MPLWLLLSSPCWLPYTPLPLWPLSYLLRLLPPSGPPMPVRPELSALCNALPLLPGCGSSPPAPFGHYSEPRTPLWLPLSSLCWILCTLPPLWPLSCFLQLLPLSGPPMPARPGFSALCSALPLLPGCGNSPPASSESHSGPRMPLWPPLSSPCWLPCIPLPLWPLSCFLRPPQLSDPPIPVRPGLSVFCSALPLQPGCGSSPPASSESHSGPRTPLWLPLFSLCWLLCTLLPLWPLSCLLQPQLPSGPPMPVRPGPSALGSALPPGSGLCSSPPAFSGPHSGPRTPLWPPLSSPCWLPCTPLPLWPLSCLPRPSLPSGPHRHRRSPGYLSWIPHPRKRSPDPGLWGLS